jgi:hypothetical protein
MDLRSRPCGFPAGPFQRIHSLCQISWDRNLTSLFTHSLDAFIKMRSACFQRPSHINMRLRVQIREQLCMLVVSTRLLAFMVLAASTWIQSYHFITQVRSSALAVTVGLKATQMPADLSLYRDLAQEVSTRNTVQTGFGQYNNGNRSELLLRSLKHNLTHALSGSIDDILLLQTAIFPRSD